MDFTAVDILGKVYDFSVWLRPKTLAVWAFFFLVGSYIIVPRFAEADKLIKQYKNFGGFNLLLAAFKKVVFALLRFLPVAYAAAFVSRFVIWDGQIGSFLSMLADVTHIVANSWILSLVTIAFGMLIVIFFAFISRIFGSRKRREPNEDDMRKYLESIEKEKYSEDKEEYRWLPP